MRRPPWYLAGPPWFLSKHPYRDACTVFHEFRGNLYADLEILLEEMRDEVRPDSKRPVKQIYGEVMDIFVNTTGKLEMLCDAIYFRWRFDFAAFPSFTPDWSHMPQTAAMGDKYMIFSASGANLRKHSMTFYELPGRSEGPPSVHPSNT